MTDAPVELDEHPWDGSAESHRLSSALAEVTGNEEALRTTQEELETQLIAAPASTWEEATRSVICSPYLRPLRACKIRDQRLWWFAIAGALDQSFRALPHELQRHASRRSRVGELHFLGGKGRNDPEVITGSDEIWERARLDVGVDGLCVFVHRIRSGIGD
jgi:hypothetical protein